MAYEPTEWKSGDVVTSAKLNNMERGIASGGVLVVTSDDVGKLDKTWQEIHDAAFAIIKFGSESDFEIDIVNAMVGSDGSYLITALSGLNYAATSANGYPEYQS